MIPPSKHPNPIPTSWKLLGKVGKPFGLKGFFYLTKNGKELSKEHLFFKTITKNNSEQILVIKEILIHQGQHLVQFKNFETRTHMEKIRGLTLWADKTIYDTSYEQVEGFKVLDIDQYTLGHVRRFYNFGAGDVVEIINNDQTLQLPFQDELFFHIQEFFQEGRYPLEHLQLKISKDIYKDLWNKKTIEQN